MDFLLTNILFVVIIVLIINQRKKILVVDNNDNQPLRIGGVYAYQLQHFLIANKQQ